jgi:hypothetical protein
MSGDLPSEHAVMPSCFYCSLGTLTPSRTYASATSYLGRQAALLNRSPVRRFCWKEQCRTDGAEIPSCLRHRLLSCPSSVRPGHHSMLKRAVLHRWARHVWDTGYSHALVPSGLVTTLCWKEQCCTDGAEIPSCLRHWLLSCPSSVRPCSRHTTSVHSHIICAVPQQDWFKTHESENRARILCV